MVQSPATTRRLSPWAPSSWAWLIATRQNPAAWHPVAAAVVLALGTGYRQDIGTLWLPVFIVILWHHRWKRAALAGVLFTALNLAWLLAMLHEAGGWSRYRQASADFAYHAGFLNSVWNLGFVDAPVRYAVKLGMALLWTLGPCLLFVPRGALRLRQTRSGGYLALLLLLTVAASARVASLVHFGVPGYGFFYVPGASGAGGPGYRRMLLWRNIDDEVRTELTRSNAARRPTLAGIGRLHGGSFPLLSDRLRPARLAR